MPRIQKVRLQDIADRASLSVAAVSMALSNSPQISEATRRRVQEISRHVNYRPLRRPRVRRTLQANAIKRVAYVIAGAGTGSPMMLNLLHVLSDLAAELNFKLEMTSCPPDDIDAQCARLADAARDVDGLLLHGHVAQELFDYAVQRRMPCILLGSIMGNPTHQIRAGHVVTSDAMAMGLASTRYLIDRGHRRIGFVVADMPTGLWYERWQAGYRYAHLDAGLPIDSQLARMLDKGGAVGERSAEVALAMSEPPTAYVVPDPDNAARLLRTLEAAGVTPERESVVIGCTLAAARESRVDHYPLVTEDMRQLAETAMRLIRQCISDETVPPSKVLLPHRTHNFPENIANA